MELFSEIWDRRGWRVEERFCFFVLFLFGDDGSEFGRRKGAAIGERAPVTCYQGFKSSSSSSFRVKCLLSSTRFCAFWMCVLDRERERERETEAHFCVTCLGRRGEVWRVPDVDAGWPERQIFVWR